ncbi:phage tail tip lysozyme [Paracoccus sp. SSJ]|uniref:phage tail tip lysozyme n=1 Tax=Paracoccus sp. SSJ TaxID=3050636 RepID=UPI00254EAC1C|nr:phage tail tip lysozyme [Paracoccus sp. SSJ]MDK8874410.1 phage tail tip lysozyme [Paracoccus sp. SSJ]
MALTPFFWGRNGQKLTPEQVAREREAASVMAKGAVDFSPVGHWSQGLGRVVQGLMAGYDMRNADRAEQEGLAAAREKVRSNPALSGYFGGSPVAAALAEASPDASAPPASPVVSAMMPQQQQPQFAPDGSIIRQGLVERGLPEHIADAFILNFQDESGLNPGINEQNPIVPGSRGGFGLAQWTGPRRRQLEAFAAQRGTPVSDMNTQLDFLMTELQGPESRAAQSILSAQDTPTAAAAIVNNFLRPAEEHRARREAAYLGGAAPSFSGGQQAQSTNIPALVEALSDPWVKQEYGPVIQALMGQEMQRQNAAYEQQLRQLDPMYQAQLAKSQFELDAMRNPAPAAPVFEGGQWWDVSGGQPQPLTDRAIDPTTLMQNLEAAGIMPGTPEYAQAIVDAVTKPQVALDNRTNPAPPSGYRNVYDEAGNLVSQEVIPGGPEDKSQQQGLKQGMADTAGDTVVTAADRALQAAQSRALGSFGQGIVGNLPWTDSAEVQRQTDVLKAMASSENINAMRQASPTGGALGNASDADLKILRDKSGALDPSSPHFERDLADYTRTLLRTIHGPDAGDQIFRQTWKGQMSQSSTSTQGQPVRRRWTPDGGLQ